ncbi:MAG TPA: nitronate monooxygenase [Thermomicrobiales bacterium]|nr:nitronate monooxygenase [Thermomicrobiales bacterium]
MRTRFTELLGITHPIVSAPMAGSAYAELVAAVSAAGGFGLIGASHATAKPERPEWLRAQIRQIRERTDRPFGVGLALCFPQFDELLAVSLAEGVAGVAISFGDVIPYVERVKAAGAVLLSQVQTVAEAKRLAVAGVDVLAAQGVEGGGHIGEISTFTLLPAVRDAVDVPVLAAGGIADGRGLAAAIMMGADGAWMGTRFVASTESASGKWHKDAIVAAGADDTVRTLAYDLARNVPFPEGIAGRAIKNRFTEQWHGRDDEIVSRREELDAEFAAAISSGTAEWSAAWAGSASEVIHSIEPAGELVRRITADAESILGRRPSAILD